MMQTKILFQQKQICSALRVKKQRVEYLILKMGLKPYISASGTGTFNYFDYRTVLECGIAHILNKWSFGFERTQKCIELINQRVVDFFDLPSEIPFSSQDRKRHLISDFTPDLGNHLILISKIPSSGLEETDPVDFSSLQEDLVDKYINVFNRESKNPAFLNERGCFILDLTLLKMDISKRLYSTKNMGYGRHLR